MKQNVTLAIIINTQILQISGILTRKIGRQHKQFVDHMHTLWMAENAS